ncbi:hypothetical protein MTO96_005372 [Rhipicephalus appendiculatus]
MVWLRNARAANLPVTTSLMMEKADALALQMGHTDFSCSSGWFDRFKKKGTVWCQICSATLWLGHVPKSVSETDLHDTFGEFGSIVRIDMIPPRGCAYVCMDRRQDAFRALQKLKNLKLQGSLIKMAWAPGKGVKGKELKDFWEVDLGRGGVIDKDSLSDGLKEKYAEQERQRGMTEPLAPMRLDMVQQQQQAPPSAEAMMAVAFPQAVAAPGAPTAVAMVPPPVPQFSIPLPPGMMPSQSLVMPQIQLPMGVPPPPNHMLMVPPNTSQTLLGPSALGLIPPPLSLPGTALGLPPPSSSYEPPRHLPSSSDAHSHHIKPSCFKCSCDNCNSATCCCSSTCCSIFCDTCRRK